MPVVFIDTTACPTVDSTDCLPIIGTMPPHGVPHFVCAHRALGTGDGIYPAQVRLILPSGQTVPLTERRRRQNRRGETTAYVYTCPQGDATLYVLE